MKSSELTTWLNELSQMNPDRSDLNKLILPLQKLLTKDYSPKLLPKIISSLTDIVELDSNLLLNRINYPFNKTAGMLVEHFRQPTQIKAFEDSYNLLTIENVIHTIPENLDKANNDSLLLFFNTLFNWSLTLPRENGKITPFSSDDKKKCRQLFYQKIKNDEVKFMLSQTYFTLRQISLLLAQEKIVSPTASNLNVSLQILFDNSLKENERLDPEHIPEARKISAFSPAIHETYFNFIANKMASTNSEDKQILVLRKKAMLFKKSTNLLSVGEELNRFNELLICSPPNGLALIEQLLLLKEKIHDFNKRGETKASDTANTLFSGLFNESIAYFSSTGYEKNNISLFNDNCNRLLETARPTLEKHRGCKQILGNIGLAIGGIGVFYLAAAMVKWAATGKFLFFSTDTEKIMDDIKKNINTPDL